MSERIPAEVFCLAEFLSDEIEARGWTTTDVAVRMGATSERELGIDLLCLDLLMCVHKDKLLVGDRMFAALAKAFDVSEEYLRRLDAVWRENSERRTPFKAPDSIFGPISRRALIRAVT